MGILRKMVVFLSVVVVLVGGCAFLWSRSQKKHIAHFREAITCLKERKPMDALVLFEKVSAGCRDAALRNKALVYMGRILNRKGEAKKAEEIWKRILEQKKSAYHDEALFNWARIQLRQGNVGGARSAFQRVVETFSKGAFVDDALYELAKLYYKDGKKREARKILSFLIKQYPSSNCRSAVEDALGRTNMEMLCSGGTTDQSRVYTVKPGESLTSIARKFNITVELLQASNSIQGNRIRPSDRLRIVDVDFSVFIDKSENILVVYNGDQFFKKYRVGTGKENCTPVGEFTVINKLFHPPWYKSGKGVVPYGSKENELGTHWLGLNLRGYGIHGTWEPHTIGTQSSAGCVRLMNKEVEELFGILPVGTTVRIVD